MNYDVVVAGAGTAGLFAAYRLAKAGLKVALVDMKPEDKVGEKVCGDAIGDHHFKSVGLEPPRVGVDATGLFEGVRVYSPSKKAYVTARGVGYALDRKAFGQRLFRMALNAGAEFYGEHFVIKPIVEESWIRGIVVKGPNSVKEIRGKVTVEATGAAGAVRNKLPGEWWISEKVPKEDYNAAYRVVAEVEEEQDPRYAIIYLDVNIAPGGYWWWFPKGKHGVNAGLGVRPDPEAPNPKHNVEKYIVPKIEEAGGKILHAGGGIVPTRRTIPCMVWNGIVAVGDAACTANPIHGGGIGPSLESSYQAARTIVEALERGEPTLEALWPYHRRYHQAYGAKQAGLDALRIYLQSLTNNELDFVIEKGIVTDRELSEMGYEGKLVDSIISKATRALTLLTKPGLLREIVAAKNYSDEAIRLFENYPETPDGYLAWREKEKALFAEIKKQFWGR